MQTLRRSLPLNLALYGLYLLVAVAITWPLVTVMSTHFAGYPFGDAHEMTRHIWWIKTALQTGQPLLFQPLLGYPDGIQGVILWSDPLQFFPGWLFALFMPLTSAYNLFALLTLALNGWAAYRLVWKLTGVRSAALLGGLTFMTAPVIQGHLAGGHGGLLVQWPLPLLVYCLLSVTGLYERVASQGKVQEKNPYPNPPPYTWEGIDTVSQQLEVVGSQDRPHPNPPHSNREGTHTVSHESQVTSQQIKTRRPRFSDNVRYVLLSILFFVLTPLGHTLQLIYAVFPLMLVIGLTVIVRRDWRALGRLVIVGVVGAGLLLIFLLPVFSSTFGTSAYTAEGGGVDFSTDLLGIVTPSFNHPLYGQLDYTHRVLGVNIVEGSAYIGIVAGLLALLALWKIKAARWWLILALVTWVLALGPLLKIFDTPISANLGGYDTHFTLPYALLFNLPGFSLARTPGRFDFLVALVVAVLVGYGWKVVVSYQSPVVSQNRKRLLAAGTVVVGLLIVLDYQSFWPLPTYDATIPQAVYNLAKRSDVRAVYDVPWDNVLAAKDALWLQTAHDKPMIAGQVTRKTPVSPAKLTILEQTLNPALLHEAGVDVVIVHKFYDKGGKLLANARKVLGNPTYEDDLLALFDVKTNAQPSITFVDTISSVKDTQSAYIYVPKTGWLQVKRSASGDHHVLSFAIDGNTIHQWDIDNNQSGNDVSLNIPIMTAGYHTLTWTLNPPCPSQYDATLDCRAITFAPSEQPYDFSQQELAPPITFAGVKLLTSNYVGQFTSRLTLDLLWQFDQPISEQDIRFIKILDRKNNAIYADDHPLGTYKKGDQWLESVFFDNPDQLPAGDYKIYAGWYTYPDLTRFKVLSDVAGAPDGWAQIGSFTVQPH